jgi:rhomboid protease GluP
VEPLFGRLLAALVAPPGGKGAAGVLAQYRDGLAVVELPGTSAAAVLIDSTDLPPFEVKRRLVTLADSQQGGMLFAVVTGGGSELRPALQAADGEARDRDHLSVYHLDLGGHLEKLGGRRSAIIERAAAEMPPVPVKVADVPGLIERGRREREEAARFVAGNRRFPPVTTALLVSCVILFGLASLWSQTSARAVVLVNMGANSAEYVAGGEWWRLLTSAFLHRDVTHLLFNMLALQSFGGFMESVLGWRRYLVLYGLSALAGALASALIMKVPLSVGASGAIWGLMLGGFALTRPRAGVLPARIAGQLRKRLLGVLVLNVILSFLPGIDFSAHFAGGALGLILIVSGVLVPRGGGDPLWLRVAALVTVLAMAGSVGTALATGRPWEPQDDRADVVLRGYLVAEPVMVKVQVMPSKVADPSHENAEALGPVSLIEPPETLPVTA